MITILYAKFNHPLREDCWRNLFDPLPAAIQQTINRFHRWQDRTASLLGKHLMIKALEPFGFTIGDLRSIRYTKYKRPFFDWPGDVNLSHSGDWIICGISSHESIGVDIERIRPIDFQDFQLYMNPDEWKDIRQSSHPLNAFFHLWTLKESVIKADGRGLSLPIQSIRINHEKAFVDSKPWWHQALDIQSGYSCHVTHSSKIDLDQIILKHHQF